DFHVTGVQTCALPIYSGHRAGVPLLARPASAAKLDVEPRLNARELKTGARWEPVFLDRLVHLRELHARHPAKLVKTTPDPPGNQIGSASCRERRRSRA